MENKIYTFPNVLTGELFPWKGFFWKVQAFSPNGGDITLKDEFHTQRAVSHKATMILEMHKPLDSHTRKATARGKNSRRHELRLAKHSEARKAYRKAKVLRDRIKAIPNNSGLVDSDGKQITSARKDD